jgi:glycosyltransferase involved in cell wall biosynthesis
LTVENSPPTQRLKVLAIATYAELGGAEVLLCEMLAGVERYGIDPTLFVFGSGPIAQRAGELGLNTVVGRIVRMSRPLTAIRGIVSLRAALLVVRPDVVHCSNPKARLLATFAMAGRSVPCTTQVLDPPQRRDAFARATRRAPGIRFAITSTAADAWRRTLNGQPVQIITPGFDQQQQVERAARGNPAVAWRRAGIADADHHPRLVMVARLQRYKGVFDLVEATALVARDHDVRVVLIGPDEPFEPDVRVELLRDIERRNLTGVIGLAGTISTDDVAATMSDAALLVHPAHRETFGLVVVEALCLGTPAIAYAAAGPSEILGGGGGSLITIGDTVALAAEIGRALDDPSLRATWGHAAVLRAAAFPASTMSESYAAAFHSLALAG